MGNRHRNRLERLGVRFVDVVDEAQSSFFVERLDSLLQKPDFVVVASPAETHYGYVKECLMRGIAVLAEKPLATTSENAWELVRLAEAKKTVLLVAQSECFNPIFLNFRKHLMAEIRGAVNAKPIRLEFRREHGFTERCRDVDVSLDILVHDLSLFLTMFKYEDVDLVDYKQMNNGDSAKMVLRVSRGEHSGIEAAFYVDRNSKNDVRTVTADFGGTSSYSVSLARYLPSGEVAHIPDSLDNEHRFFLKLLAGACGEWGRRSARIAAQVVELAVLKDKVV